MTNKAFVIGHPIAHSKSPLIHTHWLKTLGLEGSYVPIDVSPEALEGFFAELRTGAYLGGNVTIPHKQHALELCDVVANSAKEIGAVNTLVVEGNKVHGANTDISGFLANLDAKAPGWDTHNQSAIVLGAGGAARAILIGLRNRGFKNIHILNRTPKTAQDLCEELAGPFSAHQLDDFAALAPNSTLLVNTTSIGMHGTSFDDMDITRLPANALVTDIVYTPLQTPLLAAADAAGLKTVDGLGMLLHQAVPGFEAWFGKRPEVTPQLRQLAEKALVS